MDLHREIERQKRIERLEQLGNLDAVVQSEFSELTFTESLNLKSVNFLEGMMHLPNLLTNRVRNLTKTLQVVSSFVICRVYFELAFNIIELFIREVVPVSLFMKRLILSRWHESFHQSPDFFSVLCRDRIFES